MSLAEELDCVKMKLVKLSVVVLGCCDTPGPEGVLHVWQVLTMTHSVNLPGLCGERRNSKKPFCSFHYLGDKDC